MPATSRSLLGQIIKLLRAIHLQESVHEKGAKLQFIAKTPRLEALGSRPTVTLWNTARSFQAVDSIARMIHSCHPEFVDCDVEAIKDLIPRTIQDLILDTDIFRTECILLAGHQCLADCRADKDINALSKKIHGHLMTRVRASISQWCTVIGVPRVMSQSFDIPQAGIALISRMDERKWQEIVESRYDTGEWSPILGCAPNSRMPQLFDSECRSLVVHQANGTQQGAKFSSRLEYAKLFAIIYATITVNHDAKLRRAMAEPYRRCIQFPSKNSSMIQITQSQLGEAVFPFYCEDFKLSDDAIVSIRKWYLALDNLPACRKARVEKACHFVNRGMITKGLDSYVNFFISLDALFGTAGDVEGSIQRGVEAMPIDRKLKERLSWLYKLRNELVHGGSRYCSEWRGYDRYCAHFRAKPEEDVEKIACSALLNSTNM